MRVGDGATTVKRPPWSPCWRGSQASNPPPPPACPPGRRAAASLRDRWQARLALDEEVAEPAADDGQVVHAAEGRAGTGQLVRLVGHAHQAHRALQRAQHGEELLGLADRRAQVALRMLDEERRPDIRGIREWRFAVVEVRVLPGVLAVLEVAELRARDVAGLHLRGHVVDRAAGHRGPETVGGADDPTSPVTATA